MLIYTTGLAGPWLRPAYPQAVGEDMVKYLYLNENYRFQDPMQVANSDVSDKVFNIKFSQEIDYNTVDFDSVELIEKQSGERVNLKFDKSAAKELKVKPQPPLAGQQSFQNSQSYYLILIIP